MMKAVLRPKCADRRWYSERLYAGQQNARLMGVDATGNGRRQSYAHLPLPRMTNTFMENGDYSPEEVLASMKKGIYAASSAVDR